MFRLKVKNLLTLKGVFYLVGSKKSIFFLHFCGLEGARNIILKGYNRNLIISGFPEPSNIAPLHSAIHA